MPSRRQWVFDPDSGGVKIPERIRPSIAQRIQHVAEKHLAGKYIRLDIRFRGVFCYIDAYQEPDVPADWPPKEWGQTHKEFIEQLRNTPTHLCRLRYFGDDRWGFGFYTYSNERYELTVYPDGEFLGKPEDAFMTAAEFYLGAT